MTLDDTAIKIKTEEIGRASVCLLFYSPVLDQLRFYEVIGRFQITLAHFRTIFYFIPLENVQKPEIF